MTAKTARPKRIPAGTVVAVNVQGDIRPFRTVFVNSKAGTVGYLSLPLAVTADGSLTTRGHNRLQHVDTADIVGIWDV